LITQLDERYDCFTTIGLDIVQDRTYCELKYPENLDDMYNCITSELEIIPPATVRPRKGGDYCYFKYMWFDQYEELYACLKDEGFDKDSAYCNMKAEYEEFVNTEGLEGVTLEN
jgi:hypothetical protein